MLENVYELSVHGIYMYIHVVTVYIQDSECICHVYTCLYHSIRQDSLKMYMSCLYMVYTWYIHVYTNTLPWCGTRMLLNRNRLCAKQRLASVARLIGPDGKWFVLVNRVQTSTTNHACTYHILVYPCIYHVGLVIVSLEEISQSKCLAVQEWCINLWSNNNLQTGSCENSI